MEQSNISVIKILEHLGVATIEANALQAKIERYEKALKIVQKWHLPATGKFWDNEKTQPMSYAACYGSNGERDFMRNIANEALSAGEGDEIRKQNIEAEITRRWNSMEYNHIGTRTRESFREEVEKLFNQKEDKQ